MDPAGSAIIRLITPADGEALKALRLEAITTCPTAFGSDVEMTLAKDWHQRARECGGTGNEALFIAEHDGRFVGMTGVYRQTSSKSRHGCSLWGVFVRAEFRGRRIGERLVNAAVDWAARQEGVTIVRLMVTVGNDAALACYRRCGFDITGTEVATIRVAGVEYDEYLMCRRLGAEIRNPKSEIRNKSE